MIWSDGTSTVGFTLWETTETDPLLRGLWQASMGLGTRIDANELPMPDDDGEDETYGASR